MLAAKEHRRLIEMGCTLGNVGSVFCGGMDLKRAERFAKSSNGRDKFAKMLNATAGLAFEISKSVNGGGHRITREAKKVSDAAQTARDVTGLLNVFGGILVRIQSILFKVLPSLFSNLHNAKPVWLQGTSKEADRGPTHAQNLNCAEKPFQKKLALVEQIGALIAGSAYAFGFGICRVIRFVGKITGELGVGAKKMVDAFAPIMCVNHVAAIVSSGFALWRRHLRMDDIVNAGDIVKNEYRKEDPNGFAQEYAKEVVSESLDVGEKVFELICDAGKFGAPIGGAIPTAVFGVLIGLCGLTKVFVNTFEVPPPA